MRRPAALLAGVVLGAVAVAACTGERVATPPRPPAFLVAELGGDTTARALRGRPFNQAARNLTNAQLGRFASGAEPFDQRLTDPASEGPIPRTALGRDFNEDGCLGCHLDGTAAAEGDLAPGTLLRLSMPGAAADGSPLPEPTYGNQLHTDALGGPPEGRIAPGWTTERRRLADGTEVELRRPTPAAADLSRGPLAPGVLTSLRVAVPIVGMGLLEAVPESSVRAAAARQQAQGTDGVRGRVNEVWDDLGRRLGLGRFGWKAGQPTVRQQTVSALLHDMGVGVEEVPAAAFADLVFYNRTIAVPVARDVTDPAVVRGATAFESMGCAACHTPTQRSGSDDVAALSDQEFHPYTDLLLHDMGPGLADGRPEFAASGSQWRTAPLWGIGRRAETLGVAYYLHDGRARNLTEAVLWHDGEAAAARRRFERATSAERSDLLRFLGSL